jgi:hypothetical protein
MKLKNLINVKRLEVVKETEDSYIVKYNGEVYETNKSEETHFVMPSSHSMKQSLTLEQKLLPLEGIFQNYNVPSEYKEAMAFHEIRQMEYQNTEFEEGEAHERAVNDEILYTLKFFDAKTRNGFMRFASRLRKKAEKDLEKATKAAEVKEAEPYPGKIYEIHISSPNKVSLITDDHDTYHILKKNVIYGIDNFGVICDMAYAGSYTWPDMAKLIGFVKRCDATFVTNNRKLMRDLKKEGIKSVFHKPSDYWNDIKLRKLVGSHIKKK